MNINISLLNNRCYFLRFKRVWLEYAWYFRCVGV